MDPLRKVHRGQKLKGALSAAAWNAFIDNLKDVGDTGAGGVTDRVSPACTAIFVWGDDPTETLSPFSVLAYGDPVTYALPTDNPFITAGRPVFESAEPSDASLPFAITLRPVTGTNAVKVAVSGLCPVLIDVSDAGHTRAQPIVADTDKLESCSTGGVPVVWKESGTGDKWGVVLLDFAEAAGSTASFKQTNPGTNLVTSNTTFIDLSPSGFVPKLSIPSAGDYYIFLKLYAEGLVSALSGAVAAHVDAQMVDETNGDADVIEVFSLISLPVVNVTVLGSQFAASLYTAPGACTLRIDGYRSSGTWSINPPVGLGYSGYIKLS